MDLTMPVVPLELPAYSKKENWGAAETLYQLTRSLLKPQVPDQPQHNTEAWKAEGRRPRVNLLGPSLLGFRCRDDVLEVQRLLTLHGVDVGVVAPLGASVDDIQRLPQADLNVCLYPEITFEYLLL